MTDTTKLAAEIAETFSPSAISRQVEDHNRE